MLQSLALDLGAFADRTFCSWERGWRSLLLQRRTFLPEVEDAVIPAVAEHSIFLWVRGDSAVESGADGRWRSGRSVPGTVAMTAPGRPARLRWRALSAEPLESIELRLPAGTMARVVEELWDRDPARVRFPDTLATTDPLLRQTLVGLFDAAQAGAPDLYAEAAAEFVAVHTLLRHGGLPLPRAVRGDDERIRRARSFLRENLHKTLSLAEIAAEAGLSRYHFLRLFQRQTGETPHRYLTRLRIEQGREELQRGSATVGEIAARCGFANPASFSNAFRRETGCTPSAYRRLCGHPQG